MNYGVLETIDSGAAFFLGFCVLVGAAFVFYRSRRAALFFALAGLAFCLDVGADWMVMHAHARVGVTTIAMLMTVLGVGSHVLLFGGLALGLRAVAVEPR